MVTVLVPHVGGPIVAPGCPTRADRRNACGPGNRHANLRRAPRRHRKGIGHSSHRKTAGGSDGWSNCPRRRYRLWLAYSFDWWL